MITEHDILLLLQNSDAAVERAIVVIYNNQTASEQISNVTSINNGKGFSGPDAGYGSYLAKWILSGRHLSGKHLTRARNMSMKYRKQLLEAAQVKMRAQALEDAAAFQESVRVALAIQSFLI